MTDTLKAAGWRPMPDDDVRKRWEATGGRWQALGFGYRTPRIVPRGESPDLLAGSGSAADVLLRPVDQRTWNHAAWQWSAATGESLTPTEPGLHFLFRYSWTVVKVVRCGRQGDPRFGRLFVDMEVGKEMQWVPVEKVPGQWGGPVLGCPPEGFGDE